MRFKFFISGIIATLLLASCTTPAQLVPTTQTTPTTMNLRLQSVYLTQGNPQRLSFDLFIDRPEENLQEPDNSAGDLLSVDLPEGLQTDLLYVSDVNDRAPDSGNLCDRPRFPHRCEVTVTDEDLTKDTLTYLIKATFADGAYAEKEITVPVPDTMLEPTILSPTQAPAQGANFTLQFTDVGADTYKVRMALCWPYNNDGINPCLNDRMYEFTRDAKGGFSYEYTSDELNTVAATLANGVVTVTADVPQLFGESVEYSVTAVKNTEVNGTQTTTERTANVVFM